LIALGWFIALPMALFLVSIRTNGSETVES
jgi:hypothetical protein